MAIDLLSLKPHKVSRDLSGYITYIYGKEKIGKTSLAAQAPDTLLLAAERGYNGLSGIIAQDITSWSDMRQTFRELKKPGVKERFKVLIVDTIDLMAKYCTKYVCNNNGISDLGELPYGRGYAAMRSEFEDVFNALAQMGYAVIFISHDADKVIKREDGTEYSRIVPSLSPDKVNAIIANMADIYGYAHIVQDADGVPKRVLTLRSPNDSIACGCRFANIDPEIPFGYQSLVDALNRAIDSVGEDNITDAPIEPLSTPDDLDFDALINEFNTLVGKIQSVTGAEFGSKWAPKISGIVSKYLGKNKKVADCTPEQVEQLSLIVSDLKDEVGNGL